MQLHIKPSSSNPLQERFDYLSALNLRSCSHIWDDVTSSSLDTFPNIITAWGNFYTNRGLSEGFRQSIYWSGRCVNGSARNTFLFEQQIIHTLSKGYLPSSNDSHCPLLSEVSHVHVIANVLSQSCFITMTPKLIAVVKDGILQLGTFISLDAILGCIALPISFSASLVIAGRQSIFHKFYYKMCVSTPNPILGNQCRNGNAT